MLLRATELTNNINEFQSDLQLHGGLRVMLLGIGLIVSIVLFLTLAYNETIGNKPLFALCSVLFGFHFIY